MSFIRTLVSLTFVMMTGFVIAFTIDSVARNTAEVHISD